MTEVCVLLSLKSEASGPHVDLYFSRCFGTNKYEESQLCLGMLNETLGVTYRVCKGGHNHIQWFK